MRMMRFKLARQVATAATAIALLASLGAAGAFAGGPPQPSFYVDGTLYRTIGTPTDLSQTGAPARSYDVIYALGGNLMNVAEAKPGDSDYNGGRWMVLPIEWAAGVTPIQLTSDAQVVAAEADGLLTIGSTPVKQFVCPVIKIAGRQ